MNSKAKRGPGTKSKAAAAFERWYREAMKDPVYLENLRRIAPVIEELLKIEDYAFIHGRIGVDAQAEFLPIDLQAFQRSGVEEAKRVTPRRIATAVDLLKSFQISVAAGVFPHAHVLAFVAARFNSYLQQKGDISLDRAFGLPSVQRAGNPSKQDATEERRNRLCSDMWEHLKLYPESTELEAAKVALQQSDVRDPQKSISDSERDEREDELETEAETIVRYFSQWKQMFQSPKLG